MIAIKTDKGYVLKLVKNEKLVETVTQFCETHAVQSAFFYGLGGVLEVAIGFYDLDKKEYLFKKFEKTLEIVSIKGNVTKVDTKPFIHAHGVFSDEQFQCFGGHVKEATIGATCELFLVTFEKEITRAFDEEIGLKLIQCNDNSQ